MERQDYREILEMTAGRVLLVHKEILALLVDKVLMVTLVRTAMMEELALLVSVENAYLAHLTGTN